MNEKKVAVANLYEKTDHLIQQSGRVFEYSFGPQGGWGKGRTFTKICFFFAIPRAVV